MSTIASPRDSPAPHARRMNSSQAIITPTSSTRPSLDLPNSSSGSPNPNLNTTQPSSFTTTTTTKTRNNRAALRAYYKLQKEAAASTTNPPPPSTPTLEINPPPSSTYPIDPSSLMPPSELDSPTFSAPSYITTTLSTSSLSDLLRTYARILGEIRALDAEKKALVYDNYSKLISATETIRKMRSTMDPLNPMASTLDVVVARIYETASGVREELRREVPRPNTGGGAGEGVDGDQEVERRRKRTRELAVEVLAVPGRLRRLVEEGKEEEARSEWEMPRRLLERWREKGLGGEEDVEGLIEEGDSIVGYFSGRVSGEEDGD